MTLVRWTPEAASDLERIYDYFAERNPDAAHHLTATILSGLERLGQFPHSGRNGRVAGTRELVFASSPFLAIYEIVEDIHILRILHGAQR